MPAWEQKIADWIQRRLFWLGMAALLALSALLRYGLMPFRSPDYVQFLEPWYNTFAAYGGPAALWMDVGDYNYLYRFLLSLMVFLPNPVVAVKLLSIVFDYIGAGAGAYLAFVLLTQAGRPRREAWATSACVGAVLLFLPTVLINAAVWGQCDFAYSAFLLLCAAFLLRGRAVPAFLCYGVAFSFKLQAVFFLPVLVLLYFWTRRFSVLHFLLVPGTMLAASMPVIARRWAVVGASALWEPFAVYLRQTDTYQGLSYEMPNIYTFLTPEALPESRVPDFYAYCRFAGVLFTLTLLGAAVWYLLMKRPKWNGELFLLACVFSVDTCVLFLPSMHERYGFCGTLFFVIYFLLYRRLGGCVLARLAVECCTYISVLNTEQPVPPYLLAAVNLCIYACLCRTLWRAVRAASDTALAVPGTPGPDTSARGGGSGQEPTEEPQQTV